MPKGKEKLTFPQGEYDHWGYRWIGDCWLIESRDGDMLIGDRLPDDEDVAKAYCRCANRAHDEGIKWVRKKLAKSLSELEDNVNKTLKRIH